MSSGLTGNVSGYLLMRMLLIRSQPGFLNNS